MYRRASASWRLEGVNSIERTEPLVLRCSSRDTTPMASIVSCRRGGDQASRRSSEPLTQRQRDCIRSQRSIRRRRGLLADDDSRALSERKGPVAAHPLFEAQDPAVEVLLVRRSVIIELVQSRPNVIGAVEWRFELYDRDIVRRSIAPQPRTGVVDT